MRFIPLVFVASLLSCSQLFGLCRAEISGKVVDQQNQPVADALVSLQEHDGAPAHKAIRFYQSDNRGTFHASLDLSRAASYWVLWKKEDAGYPNTTLAFYIDQTPPLVTLDCGTSITGITLKFGPKAAHITRIKVLDKVTGASIADASIRLKRLTTPLLRFSKDRPTLSTSAVLFQSDSNYHGLAVPSNVDVAYEVSAPGYKPSASKTINLKPLQKIEIATELQKSDSVQQESSR